MPKKRLDAALVDGKISMSEETSLSLKHAEPVCRAEIYQALHLLTKFTLLLPLKETQRDSNLWFRVVQMLKDIPGHMLKLSTIFNLALPHTAKSNLYTMSRDALLPSSSTRAPINLLTNSMMDMFNIGQKVSIWSRTDIVAPSFSGIVQVMI